MARDDDLRPWPRCRDTWWVLGLAVLALGLFLVGFLVDLRCEYRGCRGSVPFRLLDLDAVGSLPRLFITALFLGAGVLAWWARRSSTGAAATWWTWIAVIAGALTVGKLVSLHSLLKSASPWLTLLGGVALTVASLAALTVTGRRWGVAAAGPVVLALVIYAGMALGLDLLAGLGAAVQERVGRPAIAGATFVEELGEALAALLLLLTVRRQTAAPVSAAGGGGGQVFWRAR